MLTVMEIAAELGKMDDETLRVLNTTIVDLLKSRQRTRCAQAGCHLHRGMNVYFITRDGRTIRGEVQSVGPKNTKVRQHGTNRLWIATSTLLKKDETPVTA